MKVETNDRTEYLRRAVEGVSRKFYNRVAIQDFFDGSNLLIELRSGAIVLVVEGDQASAIRLLPGVIPSVAEIYAIVEQRWGAWVEDGMNGTPSLWIVAEADAFVETTKQMGTDAAFATIIRSTNEKETQCY